MYGGLCTTYYQDQFRPYSYSRWYKRSSKKESPEISSVIVDLALQLKSDTCQVSVSNLTTRNDQYRKKALEVNQHLKVLCCEKNINIINHGNTISDHHLNGSKLHLNLKDNKVLTEKLTEAVSNSLYYIVLEKLMMTVIVFITVMNIRLHLNVL